MIADETRKQEIIKCEFKSFQSRLINMPCQTVRTGRKIVYRFLYYNVWVEVIFEIFDAIRRLRYACEEDLDLI